MLRFFIVLLLVLPALARPPAEVVDQVYSTHLQMQSQRKTVAANPKCFTPGFLGIIERAFKGQPPKPFVDVDILAHNQMGMGAYELGPIKISGRDATVGLSVWVGRGGKFSDPAMKKQSSPDKAIVYLTDVGDGDGFQIKDIEWLPTRDYNKSFYIREFLKKIADAQ